MKKMGLIFITLFFAVFTNIVGAEEAKQQDAATPTQENQNQAKRLVPGFSAALKTDYKEGTHYKKLKENPLPEKGVVEIFSFNCPACFYYETKLQMSDGIKSVLGFNSQFFRYNFANFGKLGPELTVAWAIANTLKIQDEVMPVLFDAVQVQRTITDEDSIISVFTKIDPSITKEKYESLKSDFLTRTFLAKQDSVVAQLVPPYFPIFFVNVPAHGVYQINPQALKNDDPEKFKEEFLTIVDYLLNVKK